ncbi:septal ring lytic transglycosylase RlpA family protein [Hymenobacter defluvii]|uniref:Probable endolytic peptidoglycan transglycosylase RlpA n=1 Tax=Hymenobacter defluvii TaxID=2054411 RepID=A0ABS3TBW3_9BACT|nr:septal ring lytic transglycosylase RlpA family protein [Hymenobacter defluvii]
MLFAVLLALPQTTRAARLSDDEKALTATSHRTAVLRGRASWYGREHQGRRTSSGERFDRHKYTCAHKTLPFGTRLRVTNPDNGKAVVVRVADRGPFRHARILDLSEIAARPLGIVADGSADVVAEVVPETTPLGPIAAPADLAALVEDEALALGTPLETTEVAVEVPAAAAPVVLNPTYVVQAGTFGDARNAAAMQAKILAVDQQLSVTVATETVASRSLNRVVVGGFADWATADAVRKRLQRGGITGLVRKVPAAATR